MENTSTQFSLINEKGLHIDALIENLLFMNYINMKLKDDGNND